MARKERIEDDGCCFVEFVLFFFSLQVKLALKKKGGRRRTRKGRRGKKEKPEKREGEKMGF